MSIRLILIDDHELVRKGLRLLFNSSPSIAVVGEASEGASAIQLVHQLKPDLILLDVTMPNGLDGFTTAQALREEYPEGKIILLTMHDEELYIKRAVELNIEGYLSKNSEPAALIEAIHRVAAGFSTYCTSLSGETLEQLKKQVKSGQTDANLLSRREREVVRLATLGYNNIEIGEQLNISPKTVENHKARTMQKLQLKHKHELVQFALRNKMLE